MKYIGPGLHVTGSETHSDTVSAVDESDSYSRTVHTCILYSHVYQLCDCIELTHKNFLFIVTRL